LHGSTPASSATADRLGLVTTVTAGSSLTGTLWMFFDGHRWLFSVDDPGPAESCLEVEHRWNPAMIERLPGRWLHARIAAVLQAGRPMAYTINSGIMPIFLPLPEPVRCFLVPKDHAAPGVVY
jgi:hypothetical protein